MKITKTQLKHIIKEELSKVLNESVDHGRLDEFFGPFSKDSKIRKYAQKLLDKALKKGEISNARVPDGGYHSVEILDWMGDGKISKNYPEGYSDALGKTAVYIAKAWLNREEEDKGFLPDEEKAYKGVFGRAIDDRASAKSAREKDRSDRAAADAAERDPKKFQAALRPLAKELLQGGNMVSDLEDFLDLRGLEKVAKDERAAKYRSDEYIDILAKTEAYRERYRLLKDRIERLKEKAERLGVELAIGRIDQDMAYIEKRILPRIKASWKKAYKNVEKRDKYNYASSVQVRDREGRRGPGSRAGPDMSLADAGADYYQKASLRNKISNRQRSMRESQLKRIIKEELNTYFILNEATEQERAAAQKVVQTIAANTYQAYFNEIPSASTHRPSLKMTAGNAVQGPYELFIRFDGMGQRDLDELEEYKDNPEYVSEWSKKASAVNQYVKILLQDLKGHDLFGSPTHQWHEGSLSLLISHNVNYGAFSEMEKLKDEIISKVASLHDDSKPYYRITYRTSSLPGGLGGDRSLGNMDYDAENVRAVIAQFGPGTQGRSTELILDSDGRKNPEMIELAKILDKYNSRK